MTSAHGVLRFILGLRCRPLSLNLLSIEHAGNDCTTVVPATPRDSKTEKRACFWEDEAQSSAFRKNHRPCGRLARYRTPNRSAGGAISVTRSRISGLLASGASVISRGSSRAVQA